MSKKVKIITFVLFMLLLVLYGTYIFLSRNFQNIVDGLGSRFSSAVVETELVKYSFDQNEAETLAKEFATVIDEASTGPGWAGDLLIVPMVSVPGPIATPLWTKRLLQFHVSHSGLEESVKSKAAENVGRLLTKLKRLPLEKQDTLLEPLHKLVSRDRRDNDQGSDQGSWEAKTVFRDAFSDDELRLVLNEIARISEGVEDESTGTIKDYMFVGNSLRYMFSEMKFDKR